MVVFALGNKEPKYFKDGELFRNTFSSPIFDTFRVEKFNFWTKISLKIFFFI